ncbi:MAG TPA: 3-oxoacyl-ACP reductase family protein [Bryobacteraceae bacterium]|nr:3-oxoacyl-ACP reductase family protein [Bryobacteraceae bacterium]
MSGRVALITGASRGIGRSVALALAGAGADIAVNYRVNAGAAREIEEQIAALGNRVLTIAADVSIAREAERLVRAVQEGLGPVDILVNNAGIARPQKLDEITERDWDELIAANLKSCFLMTQAALPGMRARKWGRIVNISSVAAHLGGVVGPHYAASKAGMLGLTHYYAAALAGEGITSNAISPALIDTDMVRGNLNATPARIPVGRFGDADEVASVVVMLTTNAYITGQTIHVNGGWYMS